jgi:hypothetical protein
MVLLLIPRRFPCLGTKVNEIKHTYSAKVQAALDNTSNDGLFIYRALLG